MREYFVEPKSLGVNVKVELNLSHYVTQDLKNATGVDKSNFAQKAYSAYWKFDVDKLDIDESKNVPSGFNSLESKIDKLDIRKLETTPVDLSKLSNAVKNDFVKKTKYNELVKKVNAIQTTNTSNFVKKTDYNTKISEIENKTNYYDNAKYITTQEFNFTAILKQANLTSETDIGNF